ncbi:ATP-dependent DNA helicase II subunit 2 [Golovinomyces cichoracearum]|uniref:ATP-dependent DNA helicase II subunit 2 n=1 Tax=Golovinomyces cichoracearum TaxID=62708 RepID=A0A420IA17_9PEZI|nr:ATP-dependent DNA helicase II subunit 2 [Golovinomyces cichoracearum]
MADKLAVIYVVDVGSTTRECNNGRNQSDLEYCLRYLELKIIEIIAANRVTWSVGIIAFRTNETNNRLEAEGYDNIRMLKPLGKIELSDLRQIKSELVPSNTEEGDAISAVVVAISEIIDFTQLKSGKPGKFVRKICLLTDGKGMIDPDGSEEIAKKMNESDIELVVIGTDFDDPEFGFKEENKCFLKQKNERLLAKLVSRCVKGVFGTAAAAIEQAMKPPIKTIRPYLTYEGLLELGDTRIYPDSAISIDVRRYFKTKRAKPPSANLFALRTPNVDEMKSRDRILDGEDLTIIRNARNYKVDDPSYPLGKKDVNLEDLARGYLYGRTVVPMNKADEGVTKFISFQSFTIIGFVPCHKYEKFLSMGESCITIAQPFSDKARMAMSSLVHALYELESYAVARIVPKNGKEPYIVIQAPFIEPTEVDGLIDVPLPFAEDIRNYQFPPLGKVHTKSGDEITKYQNLHSDNLQEAMSDYVDSMDLLMSSKKDENGFVNFYIMLNLSDCLTNGKLENPVSHRINHAIRQRAISPNLPVSLPADDLLSWSKPPPDLISCTTHQLDRLIKVASVKEVPPNVRGKREKKKEVEPLSGLDIDSIFSDEINSAN